MGLREVHETDLRIAGICSRMQVDGIGYNKTRADEFASILREKEQEAAARLDDVVGRKLKRTKGGGVSSKDMQLAFFGEMRAPVLTITATTGKASLGSLALQGYAVCGNAKIRDFAYAELDRRKAVKIRSTYIESKKVLAAYEGPEDGHGRMHPSWFNYGTTSGRWTCQAPNLCQLPRASSDPFLASLGGIRSLYEPAPGHVFVYYDKCLAPEARVLTTDLRWIPCGEIKEGDELIGFDEQLGYSPKMKPSKVQRVERLMKPCYRVKTDRGEVICSDNHMWVNRRGSRGSFWTETRDLMVGSKIAYYLDPWDTDTSREAGWFSGFLDGDGWAVRDGWVGFAQNDGVTLNAAVDFCRSRDLELMFNSEPAGKVNKQGITRRHTFKKVRIKKNAVDIVGRFRPVRLLDESRKLWVGKRPWGRNTPTATILEIEYIGEREVVALQTETRTFIAEGMLSHNSQIEYRIAAYGSGDENMISVCEGGDVHTNNAALLFPGMFDATEYNLLKKKGKAGHLSAAEHGRFEALDNLRTCAKSAVFAVCYFAEAPTVHQAIASKGIPIKLRTVEAMLNTMQKACRTYYKWQNDRLMTCVRTGYTDEPILGRRRWLGHAPAPPECGNHPIQAGAASIMNTEIPRVVAAAQKHSPLARIVAHVYDSVLLEVPEKDGVAVKDICREESLKPVRIGERMAVLPVDIDILERWK